MPTPHATASPQGDAALPGVAEASHHDLPRGGMCSPNGGNPSIFPPDPSHPRGPVTNLASVPTLAALPRGTGVHAPSVRRTGVSAAPPVACSLPDARTRPALRLQGKGAKHARLCAGPWVGALACMPPIPLTGAKRARAGMADVPLSSTDISLVHRERSARALASILPWSTAGFILGDSDALVTSRPVVETTERLVRALTSYGVSSVDAAHSTLGRLLSWMVEHHPGTLVVEGSHVSDFLASEQTSATTLTALVWLRDHCGLALPARGPVCRSYKRRPPAAPRSKESLSLGAIVGLEHLAAHHSSEMVRGQAAGWCLLARLALRVEQAQSCVINAFLTHEYGGEFFTILVGAVQRDKHPDPSKRRPRPFWGVADGLVEKDCLRNALVSMLHDVQQSRFLIRDTDSPDGDPTRASSWVAAPLKGASRVGASLQALLRLPPISFSAEEASAYHGHAAKRFLLNVAEASGAFSPVEACEIGRFSLSTAQSPDLEPVASMLQAHSTRASVLPGIYAGKAKVARVFDLLAKAQLVLRAAYAALSADPSLVGTGDASWGAAGPFSHPHPTPQLLLAAPANV